ncbi:toll/interleukin-1 receptor domain-containing protein [Parafrankia sp. FMc2]|uniref:toll/interleukin-1 receptor domain-containing protein n=1 Tax=Parafrankia sp. FMc2 TaxID=3233196 RepID=UPI0034D5D9E4
MTGADRAPAARVRTEADFFLSHATSDGAWAEWIAWTLEGDGYQVLIQAWDSVAGTHQPQLVQDFMRRADRVIALLSPDYLASPTSSWEWSAAAYEDPAGIVRRLVPVRIASCSATGLLRTITAVDLVGLGEREAGDRLLAALAALRVGRAKPAEAPSFPSAVRYPAPTPAAFPVGAALPASPRGTPRGSGGPGMPGGGGRAVAREHAQQSLPLGLGGRAGLCVGRRDPRDRRRRRVHTPVGRR